jgi:transposase
MFIMEGMGKQRRPRRAFTAEFKAEIVEVCRRGDRSMRQVAKDFDLTETAVRDWVRQADLDTGSRTDGLSSIERDELARLRRENRRLTEDVEILKRATLSSVGQRSSAGRWRTVGSDGSAGNVRCGQAGSVATVAGW